MPPSNAGSSDETNRYLLRQGESLLREQARLLAAEVPDADEFEEYMGRLKDYLNTCAEHVGRRARHGHAS